MGFAFFFFPSTFEEKQCSSCWDEFILEVWKESRVREEEDLSQEGDGGGALSTCVLIYQGVVLGVKGENTKGERIQGDQIIFPFVSEGKKERK